MTGDHPAKIIDVFPPSPANLSMGYSADIWIVGVKAIRSGKPYGIVVLATESPTGPIATHIERMLEQKLNDEGVG